MKRVFPLVFAILASVTVLNPERFDQAGKPLAILLTLIASSVLFGSVKAFVSVYVDEVVDEGDRLIIRNKGREEEILFKDIECVDCEVLSPNGLAIQLRRDSVFGRRIKFYPSKGWFTFSRIAESLRARIDE